MTKGAERGQEIWDTLESDIRRAIRALIGECKPSCVVLFGSRAQGEGRPDSDVDLVFVCDAADVWALAGRLLHLWNDLRRDGLKLPDADIVVRTPEQFSAEAEVPGLISFIALQEGAILHGRPPAVGKAVAAKGRE